MTSRGRSARRLVPVAVLAVLLAACSTSGADEGTQADAATVTQSITTALAEIGVNGDPGSQPAVDVPTPFGVDVFERLVLTPGAGAPVGAGQRVTVDYVGINGTDGKTFDSTFDRGASATFVLNEGEIIAGFVKALDGATIGSRVLVAVPPQDGYGTQGAPAAGIGPTDTLLFVIDIKDAKTVLTRAVGAAVTPAAGLPAVALAEDGRPTITLPTTAAPATLVVQPLVTGTGAKVEKNQVITVHYTGVIWPGGRVFDSSWERGSPAQFTIGAGKLIAGWDLGVVGLPVGSQVLLVVPPDQGYGAAGNATAGIKGTDTLVFVIDILDTAPATPSR